MDVLCVSDLHCGSNLSLMKETKEVLANGVTKYHYPNELQKLFLNEWNSMVDSVGKVDAVFCLGDLTDGSNYKDDGLGCWTTHLRTQAYCAADLLNDIHTNKYYLIGGTNYHVQKNLKTGGFVGSLLRAEGCEVIESDTDLIVNILGHRIHLMHKTAFSKTPHLKPNKIAKEMVMGQFAKELGDIDAVIRGHVHYYTKAENSRGWGITCPCWKARDDYGTHLGLGAIPDFGYVLLNIEKDSVSTTSKLFTLPKEYYVREVEL